nr:translation initiation factor IF-2-like [Equus asinus]
MALGATDLAHVVERAYLGRDGVDLHAHAVGVHPRHAGALHGLHAAAARAPHLRVAPDGPGQAAVVLRVRAAAGGQAAQGQRVGVGAGRRAAAVPAAGSGRLQQLGCFSSSRLRRSSSCTLARKQRKRTLSPFRRWMLEPKSSRSAAVTGDGPGPAPAAAAAATGADPAAAGARRAAEGQGHLPEQQRVHHAPAARLKAPGRRLQVRLQLRGQGSRRGRARAGAGSSAAGRAVPDARQMRPPQRRGPDGPRMWAPRRGTDSGRGGGRGGCASERARIAGPPPGLSGTVWRRRGSRAQRTLGRHCPSAAGPAHCRHRPRPRARPAHHAALCGAPGARGPAPEAAAPGHAHGLGLRPLQGCAAVPAPLTGCPQLWPRPAAHRSTPSPAPGPAARPGSDSSPGDADRRAAPGTRLAGTAAEPARPLKGASILGSARFPL